jgi:proteic killer suppression protein
LSNKDLILKAPYSISGKLVMLDSAVKLGDLAAGPGNKLEKLSGNRAGQYSIRINDQMADLFYLERRRPV